MSGEGLGNSVLIEGAPQGFHNPYRIHGLGIRIYGLGLGLRVEGIGLRIQDLAIEGSDEGFAVEGFGLRG